MNFYSKLQHLLEVQGVSVGYAKYLWMQNDEGSLFIVRDNDTLTVTYNSGKFEGDKLLITPFDEIYRIPENGGVFKIEPEVFNMFHFKEIKKAYEKKHSKKETEAIWNFVPEMEL